MDQNDEVELKKLAGKDSISFNNKQLFLLNGSNYVVELLTDDVCSEQKVTTTLTRKYVKKIGLSLKINFMKEYYEESLNPVVV